MPFKIQRNPIGLNQLLSIFGGQSPVELEDRVRATLDTMQFYGLQQRRVCVTNDPALAEGGTVDALGGQPPGTANQWAVLYTASFGAIKTATMTALRASIQMRRAGATGNSVTLANEELGPFGATETGSATCAFVAPYPMLLVPPWTIFGVLNILGTDATANCTVVCEVGILG